MARRSNGNRSTSRGIDATTELCAFQSLIDCVLRWSNLSPFFSPVFFSIREDPPSLAYTLQYSIPYCLQYSDSSSFLKEVLFCHWIKLSGRYTLLLFVLRWDSSLQHLVVFFVSRQTYLPFFQAFMIVLVSFCSYSSIFADRFCTLAFLPKKEQANKLFSHFCYGCLFFC